MVTRVFIFLMITAFMGCITQQKAKRWMNEHPQDAAGICAGQFPTDTTSKWIITAPDTSKYHTAYNDLSRYANDLLDSIVTMREVFKPTPQQPCPPPVNIDSLRKAIDKEIRKRLMPCKDSTREVIYTVPDKPKEKHLQDISDAKDQTISKRDNTITQLNNQIIGLKKYKTIVWVVIGLIALYIFLKLRFKLPF